jgi:hypothetical protein
MLKGFKFWSKNDGVTAVWVALAAVPIMSLTVVVIELGVVATKESSLQRLADAAAYSAGQRYISSNDVDQAEKAARFALEATGSDFNRNAFDENGFVTVSLEPEKAVFKVEVRRARGSLLSGFLNDAEMMENTYVHVVNPPAASSPCILALSTEDRWSIRRNGGGNGLIDIGSCEIQSNSNDPESVSINGSKPLTSGSGCIRAVGGIRGGGNDDCIVSDTESLPDPYADISFIPANYSDYEVTCLAYSEESQSNASASQGNSGSSEGSCIYDGEQLNGSYNGYNFGYFPHGIAFNSNQKLESGIYIVEESLTVSEGDITGDDVTFALLDDARIYIQENAKLKFSAPKSGVFEGVSIASTHDFGETNGGNGGILGSIDGTLGVDGALYFPKVNFILSGNEILGDPSDTSCMRLIVKTFRFNGNVSFYSSCENELGNGTRASKVTISDEAD